MKKALLAALLALMCLLGGVALADEAENISKGCTWKVNSTYFKATMMTDGKYTTKWQSKSVKHPYVAVTAPDSEEIYGLYVCFATMPDSYEIQVKKGDDWVTYAEGRRDYYHLYYPIPEGASGVRLYVTDSGSFNLQINEMYVLSEGDVPDWVQQWEPSVEKADILFLVGHPDDDLIFLGGAIPTYATERGCSVAIAYLTSSNTTRRSELLNALWYMGIRNYPYIGTFSDSYSTKVSAAYKNAGGESKVVSWVADLFRTCRPEVVVTHDPNGEYGHGQHKMLADACVKAFTAAADDNGDLAGWQVKKLYQHLAGDESTQIHLDWSQPLTSFDGMTGLEVAEEAFTYHVTQQSMKYDVAGTGAEYSNECFGLVETTVGADVDKNDFLENIELSAAPAEEEATAEVPETEPAVGEEIIEDEPEAEQATEEEITEDGPEAEPTETPVAETAEVAAEGSGRFTESFVASSKAADERFAARIEGYPATNADGFLDEGEFVYGDGDNTTHVTNGENAFSWAYISPTLKVLITKEHNTESKYYYLVAHLWTDVEAGVLPNSVFYDPDNRGTHVHANENALEHQVVFATNADYYTYRIKQPYNTGIEIRNSLLIYNEHYSKEVDKFPNLDTLAFYADGSCDVHQSYELDGEEYLANGAYLVYSFGPALVRDGEINPLLITNSRYTNNQAAQPRYGFGMVEPGHYVAILTEGRLKDSKGNTCKDLADLMLAEGCTEALNLDGGLTCIMLFMGQQISRMGKVDGSSTVRKTNEILAVGTSELVGQIQFK